MALTHWHSDAPRPAELSGPSADSAPWTFSRLLILYRLIPPNLTAHPPLQPTIPFPLRTRFRGEGI